MTPKDWEKRVQKIYKHNFNDFVKDSKQDIIRLKNPDNFENYSQVNDQINMVLGDFEYLLNRIKTLKEGQKRLQYHLNRLQKSNGITLRTNGKLIDRNNYLENRVKKNRTPLTKSIRHEVFVKDGFKCVECGATNQQTRLHVDHILPVAQGGTDELRNLQTLCEECNLAKNNRMWVGGTGESVEQPESDYDPDFMQKQYEIARERRLKAEDELSTGKRRLL
jgi:5-methylcytosine-specific restriction endonuclease McrA